MVHQAITIAIPTYNRSSILQKTISRLLEVTDDSVIIHVFDNFSTDSTQNSANNIIQSHPHRKIRYTRHPCNIGASANVLRCLELVETKWVWVLGDDDEPTSDCQEMIYRQIAKYPEAYAINFETSISKLHEGIRESDKVSLNTSQLISSLADFSNFLFVSASVYNRDKILPFIEWGYDGISTHGPHAAILLKASESGNDFLHVFSTGSICQWEPNLRGDHWNDKIVGPALQMLVRYISTPANQALLSNKISRVHFCHDVQDLDSLIVDSKDDLIVKLQSVAPSAFIRALATNRLLSFSISLLAKILRLEKPLLGKFLNGGRRIFKSFFASSASH
jgi:hypothetical protein